MDIALPVIERPLSVVLHVQAHVVADAILVIRRKWSRGVDIQQIDRMVI
jgi:hypothetical protein